ncbi:NUDIX domain-containing protein [Nocardia sp. NPDC019395]|uniref:NUDIX domain-containing protein n=1 Tax=Nocardia sp. NPDC019395 TaxID=3154686 RepID=UPI0033E04883
MAIPFPPADLAGLLGWVGGSEIPVGNEDFAEVMREGFDDLKRQLLDEELTRIDEAIAAVRAAYPHGDGGAAILAELRSVRADVESTGEEFGRLADSIHEFGGEIVAAKLNGIIGLTWLAAELIWALTLGPAGPLAQATAIAATRYFFRMIGLRLAAWIRGKLPGLLIDRGLRTAASHFVYEAIQEGFEEFAQGTVQEVVVQSVLIHDGYRSGYDWNALGTNAVVSAGAGAAAGVGGHFLHRGASRLPLGADRWGGLARGGLVGSGAELVGVGAAWAIQGGMTGAWEFDPRSLTGALAGAAPSMAYGWLGGGDYSGKPITPDDYRRVRVGNPELDAAPGEEARPEVQARRSSEASARAGDSARNGVPGGEDRWAPPGAGEAGLPDSSEAGVRRSLSACEVGTPIGASVVEGDAGAAPNVVASRDGSEAGEQRIAPDADAGARDGAGLDDSGSRMDESDSPTTEYGSRKGGPGLGSDADSTGFGVVAGERASGTGEHGERVWDGRDAETVGPGRGAGSDSIADPGAGGSEGGAGVPPGETVGVPGAAGRDPVDVIAALADTLARRHPGGLIESPGPVDAAGMDMRALEQVFDGNFVRAGIERGATPKQESWRLQLLAGREERRLTGIGHSRARHAKKHARQRDEAVRTEVEELRRIRAGLAAGRDPGANIEAELAGIARSRSRETQGLSDADRWMVYADLLGEQIEEKQTARQRARAAELAAGARSAAEFTERGAREKARLERLAGRRRGIEKEEWRERSTPEHLRESLEELGPGGTLVVVEEFGRADANGVNARPYALYLAGDTVMVADGVSDGPAPFDFTARTGIERTFVAGIRGDGVPTRPAPASGSGRPERGPGAPAPQGSNPGTEQGYTGAVAEDDAPPVTGHPRQVVDGTARYQVDPRFPEEVVAAAGVDAAMRDTADTPFGAAPAVGVAKSRVAALAAAEMNTLTAPLPVGVASSREAFEAEAERLYHEAVESGAPEIAEPVEPSAWREDVDPHYHLWVSGTQETIAALRAHLPKFARGRGEFDQRTTASGAATLAIPVEDHVALGQTLRDITRFQAGHPAGFTHELPVGAQPVPECPGVGFSAIPAVEIRRRLRDLELLLHLPDGRKMVELLRARTYIEADNTPVGRERRSAYERELVRQARRLALPESGGPEIVQALRALRDVDENDSLALHRRLREVYHRIRPALVDGPQAITAITNATLRRYLAETDSTARNCDDFLVTLRDQLWFIGIDPARPHLELGDEAFGALEDAVPPHRGTTLSAGEQAEEVVERIRDLYSRADMELPAGESGPARSDRGPAAAFRGSLDRFGTSEQGYRDAYAALGRELLEIGPGSTAVVAEQSAGGERSVYLVRNISGQLSVEKPEGRIRGTAYTFDAAVRPMGEVRATLLDDAGCAVAPGHARTIAEALADPAAHPGAVEREIDRLRAECDRLLANPVPGVSGNLAEHRIRELIDRDPHELVVAVEKIRPDLWYPFTGDQRPLHLLRLARRLEIARLSVDEWPAGEATRAEPLEIPASDTSDITTSSESAGQESVTTAQHGLPSADQDIRQLLQSRWEGLKYSTDRGPDYWRRLTGLFDDDGTSVIVALDHALTDGPVVRDAKEFGPLIRAVLENGANGVFLHRGNASRFARTDADGLVLHVTGGPVIGEDADGDGLLRADPNHKLLLGSAESIVREAQRLDVDAVSVHVNVGSPGNAEQEAEVAELGRALSEADIPLIIMSYPRGPGISPDNLDHVLTAVSQAVLLGADIVKTSIPKWPDGAVDTEDRPIGGSPNLAAMRAVVASSHVPVVFAGGSNWTIPMEQIVAAVRESGAAGLAVGRMVFRNPDSLSPGAAMRLVDDALRGDAVPRLPDKGSDASTWESWAETRYDAARADDTDVERIAAYLAGIAADPAGHGLSPEDLARLLEVSDVDTLGAVKNHLYFNEHDLIDDLTGERVVARFRANHLIAETWRDLSLGCPLHRDTLMSHVELLRHEAAEQRFEARWFSAWGKLPPFEIMHGEANGEADWEHQLQDLLPTANTDPRYLPAQSGGQLIEPGGPDRGAGAERNRITRIRELDVEIQKRAAEVRRQGTLSSGSDLASRVLQIPQFRLRELWRERDQLTDGLIADGVLKHGGQDDVRAVQGESARAFDSVRERAGAAYARLRAIATEYDVDAAVTEVRDLLDAIGERMTVTDRGDIGSEAQVEGSLTDAEFLVERRAARFRTAVEMYEAAIEYHASQERSARAGVPLAPVGAAGSAEFHRGRVEDARRAAEASVAERRQRIAADLRELAVHAGLDLDAAIRERTEGDPEAMRVARAALGNARHLHGRLTTWIATERGSIATAGQDPAAAAGAAHRRRIAQVDRVERALLRLQRGDLIAQAAAWKLTDQDRAARTCMADHKSAWLTARLEASRALHAANRRMRTIAGLDPIGESAGLGEDFRQQLRHREATVQADLAGTPGSGNRRNGQRRFDDTTGGRRARRVLQAQLGQIHRIRAAFDRAEYELHCAEIDLALLEAELPGAAVAVWDPQSRPRRNDTVLEQGRSTEKDQGKGDSDGTAGVLRPGSGRPGEDRVSVRGDRGDGPAPDHRQADESLRGPERGLTRDGGLDGGTDPGPPPGPGRVAGEGNDPGVTEIAGGHGESAVDREPPPDMRAADPAVDQPDDSAGETPEFDVVSAEVAHDGSSYRMLKYKVRMPDGNVYPRDVLDVPATVAVLPVDRKGRVVLSRRFRAAVDDVVLELPSGVFTADGDLPVTARGILAEYGLETGAELSLVTDAVRSGGSSNAVTRVLIAREVDDIEGAEPPPDMLRMPLTEAVAHLTGAALVDTATAVGVLAAAGETSGEIRLRPATDPPLNPLPAASGTPPVDSTRVFGARRLWRGAEDTVWSSPYNEVRRLELHTPDDGVVSQDVITRHATVLALPWDERTGEVVLVRQYRAPLGRWIYQLPAGMLDKTGEDPLTGARRELAEEAGLAALHWSEILTVEPLPGVTDEHHRIYLARNLYGIPRLDAGESDEIGMGQVRIPVDEALAMAMRGEIDDGPAVISLLALASVRAGRSAPRVVVESGQRSATENSTGRGVLPADPPPPPADGVVPDRADGGSGTGARPEPEPEPAVSGVPPSSWESGELPNDDRFLTDRNRAVTRACTEAGVETPEGYAAVARAYELAYGSLAPFFVKHGIAIAEDCARDVARGGRVKVAYLARDGYALSEVAAVWDPEFFGEHCGILPISRIMLASVWHDTNRDDIGTGEEPSMSARLVLGKGDPSENSAGAREKFIEMAQANGVPLTDPGSEIVLVDSGLRGTIQHALSELFPDITFRGRYLAYMAHSDSGNSESVQGYAMHVPLAESNGAGYFPDLPDEPGLTFGHYDANKIKNLVRGTDSSATAVRFVDVAGVLALRSDQQIESPLFDDINPLRISEHYADPAVRLAVGNANFYAVHDLTARVAEWRDSGVDWQPIIDRHADRAVTKIRAWVGGTSMDDAWNELLDSFVARTDGLAIRRLKEVIAERGLSENETRHLWENFIGLPSLEAKESFAGEFRAADTSVPGWARRFTEQRVVEQDPRGQSAPDRRPGHSGTRPVDQSMVEQRPNESDSGVPGPETWVLERDLDEVGIAAMAPELAQKRIAWRAAQDKLKSELFGRLRTDYSDLFPGSIIHDPGRAGGDALNNPDSEFRRYVDEYYERLRVEINRDIAALPRWVPGSATGTTPESSLESTRTLQVVGDLWLMPDRPKVLTSLLADFARLHGIVARIREFAQYTGWIDAIDAMDSAMYRESAHPGAGPLTLAELRARAAEFGARAAEMDTVATTVRQTGQLLMNLASDSGVQLNVGKARRRDVLPGAQTVARLRREVEELELQAKTRPFPDPDGWQPVVARLGTLNRLLRTIATFDACSLELEERRFELDTLAVSGSSVEPSLPQDSPLKWEAGRSLEWLAKIRIALSDPLTSIEYYEPTDNVPPDVRRQRWFTGLEALDRAVRYAWAEFEFASRAEVDDHGRTRAIERMYWQWRVEQLAARASVLVDQSVVRTNSFGELQQLYWKLGPLVEGSEFDRNTGFASSYRDELDDAMRRPVSPGRLLSLVDDIREQLVLEQVERADRFGDDVVAGVHATDPDAEDRIAQVLLDIEEVAGRLESVIGDLGVIERQLDSLLGTDSAWQVLAGLVPDAGEAIAPHRRPDTQDAAWEPNRCGERLLADIERVFGRDDLGDLTGVGDLSGVLVSQLERALADDPDGEVPRAVRIPGVAEIETGVRRLMTSGQKCGGVALFDPRVTSTAAGEQGHTYLIEWSVDAQGEPRFFSHDDQGRVNAQTLSAADRSAAGGVQFVLPDAGFGGPVFVTFLDTEARVQAVPQPPDHWRARSDSEDFPVGADDAVPEDSAPGDLPPDVHEAVRTAPPRDTGLDSELGPDGRDSVSPSALARQRGGAPAGQISPAAPVPAYRDSAPVGRDRRLRWPFWRTVDPARAYSVPPALPWLNRNVYQVRYMGPDAGGALRDNPEDSGYLRSPVAPDEWFDRIESLHAWLEAEDLIRPVAEDLALTSARRDIAWRLDELAEHAEMLYRRQSEYRALSGAEPRSRTEQAGELIELRSAFATHSGRILELAEEYGISLGKPVTLGIGLQQLARESAQLRLESDAPFATATDRIIGIGRLRSAIAWARAQVDLADRRFIEYRDNSAEFEYPELSGANITDVAALRNSVMRPRSDPVDRPALPERLLEFAEYRALWSDREAQLLELAGELHLLAGEHFRLSGTYLPPAEAEHRTAELARIDKALAAGFGSRVDSLLATTEAVGDLAAYRPPDTHLDMARSDLLCVYRARDAAYAALGLAVPAGSPAPVARYSGTYGRRAPEVVGADWEPGGWPDPGALFERVRTTGDAVVATVGYRGLFRVGRVGSHAVAVFRDGTEVTVFDNGAVISFGRWVAAGAEKWRSSQIFGMVVHPDGTPGTPLVVGKSQAVVVLDYFPGSIGGGEPVRSMPAVDGPDPGRGGGGG